ncbi:MAG: hypothetical protein KDA66_17290 [Planctomycetaceae bacterium]|nr:hypothetical protein [Planctomycetaceae bacterium]
MNTRTHFAVFAFTAMLAWGAAAHAETANGIVANGSCTPKRGDDVELSIHTPRNDEPSIGQKSGTRYLLLTVIQGGEREGTSIKGGKRTTLMFTRDQAELNEILKMKGARDGVKMGLGEIRFVSDALQFGRGDTLTISENKITISRKGKPVGTFEIEMD